MIQFEQNKVYTNIHDAFVWNGYKPADIVPVDPVSAALQNADSVKDRIQVVQDELLKMPQADIKTIHSFTPGKYHRTIIIPSGVMLTGAEHKTSYRVKLEKGTITVNLGTNVKTLTAPCEFDAPAGAQRVGYAHDEVIWTDIYDNPDDCVNIEKLENDLYVVPECDLGENRVKREISDARKDYDLFLNQLGTTQEIMDSVVQNHSDLIDMPDGFFVELKPSVIHGMGMFATKNFEPGELVCPGRIDGKRTPAGRFTNHSPKYNIVPEKVGDDIIAIAFRKIYAGEELLVDYRDSMRVNIGLIL